MRLDGLNAIIGITLILLLAFNVSALDYLYEAYQPASPATIDAFTSNGTAIASVAGIEEYPIAREIYNDTWIVGGDVMYNIANLSVTRDVYEFPFDQNSSYKQPLNYDNETNLIFGVFNSTTMQALDADTGTRSWRSSELVGIDRIISAIVDDSYVHVAAEDFAGDFTALYRLNKTDGTIIETYATTNVTASPWFRAPLEIAVDTTYVYAATQGAGTNSLCSSYRFNKTNYSDYDCYVNVTSQLDFAFQADAYSVLVFEDLLFLGISDYVVAWNRTNNSQHWLSPRNAETGFMAGYMGMSTNGTVLYTRDNTEMLFWHDVTDGSLLATYDSVVPSGHNARFGTPLVVVSESTYDAASSPTPEEPSGGGGGSATPPPTIDEETDEAPVEEELTPIEEFLKTFFPSRAKLNATITALPNTVYINRYNEFGELVITNMLDREETYRVTMTSTTLEGLGPFENQTSITLDVPARQSLQGNKRFLQYTVPFDDYEEGTYQATFELSDSNGTTIDTARPNIVVRDDWLSRFLGALGGRFLGAITFLQLLVFILLLMIVSIIVSKAPRATARRRGRRT